MNYLSDLYGPYPFDSTGAVADRATGVGYALEVQGKPHYSGSFTFGNPSINIGTQLHELAHQWFGNSVTLATWADIWFNEGWANWSEWYWDFQTQGGDDPAVIFDDLYANTPAEDWEIAPAILDGDPANLFAFFPTYQRGAMTVEGYRQIVGDQRFFAFASGLLTEFEHGNISTERVHRGGEAGERAHRRGARPARRLLPAVALRRDEADDPARRLQLSVPGPTRREPQAAGDVFVSAGGSLSRSAA